MNQEQLISIREGLGELRDDIEKHVNQISDPDYLRYFDRVQFLSIHDRLGLLLNMAKEL